MLKIIMGNNLLGWCEDVFAFGQQKIIGSKNEFSLLRDKISNLLI